MYFAGWVSFLLIIPPLSDKYGRKKMFVIGMALLFSVEAGIIFLSYDLTVIIVGFFFMGVLCSFRMNIGWIYF